MKLSNKNTPAEQHSVYFRAIITWLLFIPIAFINGTLRELVYRPLTGELAAHQISTAIASTAFFTLAYFCLRHHLQTTSRNSLFLIGSMWGVLTFLFEFALGRFVSGDSWESLLNDYNITEGRIWILLLLTVFLAPLIINKMVTGNTTKYEYSK